MQQDEVAIAMAWRAVEKEAATFKRQAEMQSEWLREMDATLREKCLEVDAARRKRDEDVKWHAGRIAILERRNVLLEDELHAALLARRPVADAATQTKPSPVKWRRGDPWEFVPLSLRRKKPAAGKVRVAPRRIMRASALRR